MKKKTACILVLMLILTLVCAFPALSSEPVSGESLAEVDVDASAFLAGQNTDSKANVRGVLFAAGYNVEAGGVSEYAIAAGYNVLLSGDVENDTILAGNIVSINGNVGRDVYAAAQNISISGNVARNVYAAGNSVTVSGTVLGDLDIAAAQIMISENAVIEGTLRYNSSAEIVAPESVLLSAEAYADESEENTEVSASSQITGTIISKIFSYVGVLILALLLLLATPLWETVDKKYEGATFGKYAAAFGIGLGVLVLLPVASVILMITGFGLRLAFILLMLYAAAIIAAPIFISFFVGKLLWRGAFKKNICYPAELAIGVLVWLIASNISILSMITGLVTAPLGVGMWVLLLGKKKAEPEIPVLTQNTPDAPLGE